MKIKNEKRLLFLLLVILIFIAFIFMFLNIRNLVLYGILLTITFIIFLTLLYIMDKESRNKTDDLNQLLYYDNITKLPNKNKFLNDLSIKIKARDKYAVVVFDMKNFKTLVDLCGINEKNRYLKYIADILSKSIASNELCANTGDEHFALLLTYNYPIEVVSRIKKINDEIINYSSNLKIDLSFGVYCISDKRFSPSLMFNKADLARKSIVNRYDILYAFYDEAVRNSNIELSDIENYMEQSFNNNDFIVYYQPKYKIARKKLVGFEALIRWNHPKRGILFPDKFIPIFESNGFIKKIDFYVLENVCKLLRKYPNLKEKSISINLSRENLKNPNLVGEILYIVDKYKVNHGIIEFEFTESMVFDNIKLFIEVIKELKKMGFKTSIDDFGMGNSSLSLLQNLPVDILKIDKNFLEGDSNNVEIVISNIIKLAKKLNMEVIVEGIETKEEVHMLKRLECDYGQGYYYSKPLIKKEADKLLK